MIPICERGSVLLDGPDGLIKEGLVRAAGLQTLNLRALWSSYTRSERLNICHPRYSPKLTLVTEDGMEDDTQNIRALWRKYRIGQSVQLANKNWRHAGPNQLGFYLAKYLAKQWPSWGADARLRRWSSSRQFLPAAIVRRQSFETGWCHGSVEQHRSERRHAGATIRDFRSGFHYELAAEMHQPADPATSATYTMPGLSFREGLKIGRARYERYT